MQSILAAYLHELALKRANPLSTDELSLRDALSELLNASAAHLGRKVQFVGEAKKIAQGTRPDYIVTRLGVPIGYIEAEKYGADLSDLKGHAKHQNAAFIANLDSFLLSNHLEFRLYHKGKPVASATFPADAKDLTDKHENDWRALLERFLSGELETIANPRDLATLLARRARLLAGAALEDLQTPDESPVDFAFEQFKRELLTDIHQADFADVYAETLTYGLFAARCLTDADFSIKDAAKTLKNIPLLSSLFLNYEHQLDDNLRWILDEIVALLDAAPMEKITGYFQDRVGRADPMLDFYEPFLAAFDSKKRESRGVYYTPEPVVGYMVRSVAQLLSRDFGRQITDKDVQILDPATGTGSFLFAVVDEIHRQMNDFGAWDDEALDETLARLFGLEIMVAPYTIAHLKLRLQLEAFGPKPKNRLGIYLSNTLDDPRGTYGSTADLARELKASDAIKGQSEILVVLGNPPYSGHSSNLTTRIEGGKKILSAVGKRVESYKTVDGVALGERNSKWLQDDYVKFLAFAQGRIEKTGEGIVAFITNHGYLDNPTFRGLRASLMDSFDALYILDLHGNSKKKEVAPDGGKDENVFAIQQGVAILLAVKHKTKKKTARAEVFHADLWGRQKEKYAALEAQDVTTTEWKKLAPSAPHYLLSPRDETDLAEYEKGWKVTDIFAVNNVGLVTARDSLTIHFSADEVWKTVTDFASLPIEEARAKYKLGSDVRDWRVEWAQNDLKNSELSKDFIRPILYRPFDTRQTYFTGKSRGFICMPRTSTMAHMNRPNIGLITARSNKSPQADHFFVSKNMTEAKTGESTTQSGLFPLYLYSDGLFGPEKRANLNPKFVAEIETIVGESPSPEAIFAFIYATLHGPQYRAKYAAFLKTDFPRIPLPRDKSHFEALQLLGEKLVALHLLDAKSAPELKSNRFKPSGAGANVVSGARWENGAVFFNATRGFEGVPQTVWEFKIGGYQVAKKWLDDRKGRALGFEELGHYAQILAALEATGAIMDELKTIEK